MTREIPMATQRGCWDAWKKTEDERARPEASRLPYHSTEEAKRASQVLTDEFIRANPDRRNIINGIFWLAFKRAEQTVDEFTSHRDRHGYPVMPVMPVISRLSTKKQRKRFEERRKGLEERRKKFEELKEIRSIYRGRWDTTRFLIMTIDIPEALREHTFKLYERLSPEQKRKALLSMAGLS